MDATGDRQWAALPRLLQETVSAYLSPVARVAAIEPRPIGAGLSGAAVRRYRVEIDPPSFAPGELSLVTKEAGLVERRVLALLAAQGQPNVPFSRSADLTTDGPALVCLQDLGDAHRPTVLDSITPEAIRREAHGLALIHHANRGRADDLAWLPRADHAHFADAIMETYWKPAWSQALADPAFARQFAPYIAAVEDAAARIPGEIDALNHNDAERTLIHGDINPSNVLLHAGRPYFIDWQAALYGSFYLDLPHHLHTRDLAESYRAARAALGDEIPAAEFGACLRVAARYIGLRYMWWTLAEWQDDHTATAWVYHYLNMVVG